MLETALIAFTTYFATIGPADVAALFAALTPDNTPAERRAMAIRGTPIATAILLLFALFGEAALRLFGISLPARLTKARMFSLREGGVSPDYGMSECEDVLWTSSVDGVLRARLRGAGPGTFGGVAHHYAQLPDGVGDVV